MSETKWTPGPWKWETDGEGVARLRQVGRMGTCPDFDGLDPIVDDGSAGGEYGQTIEPNTPNARLIAAAPELYEALEEFERVAESVLDPERAKLDGPLIKARAVLAKARGEFPDAK